MLQGIQCLRAVAALLVVFLHAVECQEKYGRGTLPWVATLNTSFGVDIFFVISGLIMVLVTDGRMNGLSGAAVFLRKRLIRIVPPYWFYTTVIVATALLVPQAFDRFRIDVLHVVQSYLFLPAPNPAGQVLPVLIVGWTLCYEMYFYLVLAALLLFPPRLVLPALTFFFGGSVLFGAVSPQNPPELAGTVLEILKQ